MWSRQDTINPHQLTRGIPDTSFNFLPFLEREIVEGLYTLLYVKRVHARRVKLWKRLEAKNCGEKLLNSYISRIKVINNRISGNSQTHYKHVAHETLFSKLFYQKKRLRKTKISHRTLCFTHVTYAFRVNLHAEVSWMIGNCLLKTGVVFEDSVTATGIERITI